MSTQKVSSQTIATFGWILIAILSKRFNQPKELVSELVSEIYAQHGFAVDPKLFTKQVQAWALPASRGGMTVERLREMAAKFNLLTNNRKRPELIALLANHSKINCEPAPQAGLILITFGDCAENHKGMQKIGQAAEAGFTCDELFQICSTLTNKHYECEIVDLAQALPANVQENYPACVLIIRNSLRLFGTNNKAFWAEQRPLPYDTQAKMYGRVVNKTARHNLCFGDTAQTANYEQGKGTIIAFDELPILNTIRQKLPAIFGQKAKGLVAESNLYYDNTTGIGFHGDTERRIVICFRLGASIPLHYQWFYKGAAVGTRIELQLNGGDLYIMSEKAVGFDWKKSSMYTLRHAAGAKKYLTI